jgi:hypothetical protein
MMVLFIASIINNINYIITDIIRYIYHVCLYCVIINTIDHVKTYNHYFDGGGSRLVWHLICFTPLQVHLTL